MELSAAEVGLIVDALRPRCVPGRLRRIVQPDAQTIILGVHCQRVQLWLRLTARAGHSALVLQPNRPPAPERPPRFCALLRSRLDGARLTGLRQIGGDRRVLLELRARGEELSLEARLIGRGADLILRDSDGVTLGTLSGRPQPEDPPVPSRASATRSRFGPGPDLLEQVRHAVEADEARRIFAARRTELLRATRRAWAKACRRVQGVQGDLARADQAEVLRRQGELLRDSFHLLARGMSSVVVVDYLDPALGEVEVPLDPALGPQANVRRCFKRYHALRNAQKRIVERLERARQTAAALAQRLSALEAATELDELERVAACLQRGHVHTARPAQGAAGTRARPSRAASAAPAGIRTVALEGGCRALVGRGARENDALTFRFARGNDVWLHVQDWPGPHVVVQPAAKGASIPESAILDAAQLAVHFCRPARAQGRAEVLRTQVKHLRRGTRPGEAFVAGGRSHLVRLDPQRVDALLGGEREGGAA